MKTILTAIFAFFAISQFALADLINITPGVPVALPNGDVVFCAAPQAPPPPPPPQVVEVNCTLMISGLPPFSGKNSSTNVELAAERARNAAKEQCDNYARGKTFLDFSRRQYDPCVRNPSMSALWMGYNCKSRNISE